MKKAPKKAKRSVRAKPKAVHNAHSERVVGPLEDLLPPVQAPTFARPPERSWLQRITDFFRGRA